MESGQWSVVSEQKKIDDPFTFRARLPFAKRRQLFLSDYCQFARKLSVLVPLFNEAGTIATLLERLLSLGDLLHEIIVVDDGSTDGSAQVVAHLAEDEPLIHLLQTGRNGGKTAAIRHALEQATGDIIIIQDADLEYDPRDIPAVIAPILDGQADVVYGSRFMPPACRVRGTHLVDAGALHAPYICHYLANVGLTWLSNLLTRRRLTDIETCFKAFRAGVIKPLQLTSRGFGMEVEITALVCRTNARIHEVPISYRARSYRDGKKIGFRDGVMAAWYICWYNLVQRWFPSSHRYRRAVNSFLLEQSPPIAKAALARAA